MAVRLWLETGSLTDGVFTDLCWHYARCVEDTPEIREKLLAAFEASPCTAGSGCSGSYGIKAETPC